MILPLHVNIGVTGHRTIVDEHKARIDEQVAFTMQKVKSIAQSLCKSHTNVFEPNPVCSVFSCLSEGADRLVAEIGLKNDFSLHAVLPFPITSQVHALDLQDDAQTASRTALKELVNKADTVFQLGPDDTQGVTNSEADKKLRHDSYFAASQCMLEYSNIVLALWSGEEQPMASSTYGTICLAKQSRKCIFWVHTKNNQTLHYYDYDKKSFVPVEDIDHILLNIFTPPSDVILQNCLQEVKLVQQKTFRKVRWHTWWKSFYNLLSPPIQSDQSQSAEQNEQTSSHVIQPIFDVFSNLAGYYASLYRTFFFLASILGFAAVTIATFALATPSFSYLGITDGGIKIVFAVLELCCLTALWFIHDQSQKGQWQHKFTYYRLIAEILRHNCTLSGMGLAPRLRTSLPFYGDQSPAWLVWLMSCILSVQKSPNHMWEQVQDSEQEKLIAHIADQVAYHTINAKRCHIAEHRLHQLSEGLFIGTFLCIVLGLLGKVFSVPYVVSILAPLGIILPLFAMGTHALSVYAEFRRLHDRSSAMSIALAKAQTTAEQASNYTELRKIAEKSVSIMLSEVAEWSVQSKMAQVAKA